MKILFIMSMLRGRGAERVASVLTEQLSSLSHKVFLICTGPRYGDEFPVSKDIHLDFITKKPGNPIILFYKRVHYLRRLIKTIKPDCIVSLADARKLFLITVAHLFSSVPMIFSERHDPVHNPKRKINRIMRLISYHACDRVVFQTEDARDFFSKSIAKKGIIIPNPIMEGLPDTRNQEQKPYIVNFCNLDPQKNLSLLLGAFSRIYKRYPSYRLVIYGEGGQAKDLKQLAEQLGIISRTDFFPHALDVHDRIKDAAMFVSSSDYEGQSNSMLEAMAMGLPCVCTDCPCGGARAVITNGKNGLLVPVGDEEKLAEAMCYMLDHPEEARRMGNSAAEIREERTPLIIAREWEKLLLETVSLSYKNH